MDTFLQDPVFYWLMWAIASVIGVLVGWWLRAVLPEREIARALARSEQDRNALARLFAQIRDQHELREADLKKATLELTNLRQEVARYELEKAVSASTQQANAARLEKAEAQVIHYNEKIRFLEEQLQTLRQRNETLNAELAKLHEEINAWRVLYRDFAAMQRQLHALEDHAKMLEQERDHLRRQLQLARIEIENLQIMGVRKPAPLDPPQIQHNKYFAPSNEGSAGPAYPSAMGEHSDDLKIINGITSFAEQQLHALGVFTFAQISRWDDAMIASVSKTTGIPFDKIKQEDWVGQAQHLLYGYKS